MKTNSKGAANLAKTVKFLRGTRHIDPDISIRHEVQKENLRVPNKENLTDALTKLTPMQKIKKWKRCGQGSIGTQ